MKLNFREFKMPQGVSGKTVVSVDMRESFADAVYNCCNGIFAHTLAMKIYKSEGETEFDDREMEMIQSLANERCKPSIIDGLAMQTKTWSDNSN